MTARGGKIHDHPPDVESGIQFNGLDSMTFEGIHYMGGLLAIQLRYFRIGWELRAPSLESSWILQASQSFEHSRITSIQMFIKLVKKAGVLLYSGFLGFALRTVLFSKNLPTTPPNSHHIICHISS